MKSGPISQGHSALSDQGRLWWGDSEPLLFTSTEPTLTIAGLVLRWTPPARPPPETEHFGCLHLPTFIPSKPSKVRVADSIFSRGNRLWESLQELACHRAGTWPCYRFEPRSFWPQIGSSTGALARTSLILLKLLFCSSVQRNDSISWPLVVWPLVWILESRFCQALPCLRKDEDFFCLWGT